MRCVSRVPTTLVLALLAAPFSPLHSQDRPTRFTADLGVVNAAGNSSVTSFNLGQRILYTDGPWKLTQEFAALYGRTDGEKSAEQVRVAGRVDHTLGDRLALYGRVGWDRNVFAGLHRRFEEGFGLAFKVVEAPRTEFDIEGGLGATQQVNTRDERRAYVNGRLAGRFRQGLGEKAHVRQLLEFIPNFERRTDYRILSESSLVAPLSNAIALKVSYVVRFDNQPEPGFRKSDRVLTTGVQLNW